MKTFFILFIGLTFSTHVLAQAPPGVTHQLIVRDSQGDVITNETIGVRISILQGSAEGTAVFVETHTPVSNDNGLINYIVGQGNTSNDFGDIDWTNGPYFIKTDIDVTGGTNYTLSGVNQILSVPYALHAETAENVTGGIAETDPSVPTGTQTGEMQYWDGTEWVTLAAGNEGQVLTFTGGVPTWKTEVGDNFVINVTTGKIWMDKNLGASQVATNSTDTDAYGDLYQWGRGTDGHQIRSSVTTSTVSISDTPGHGKFITPDSSPFDWRDPQNDDLWQGVSGTNNPCPGGYRLPTEPEWYAERDSWSSNDSDGAFASPLKLPVAGYRLGSNGSFGGVNSSGLYWSGTVTGNVSKVLSFGSGMIDRNRANGHSVRCLKD